MKLNVAATALASAVVSMASVPTVSAVSSNAAAAGTCLSAVIANAGQQQDVDWSDEAAYYTIGNANNNVYYNNNANNGEDGDDQEDGEEEQEQEAEAQQAEYNIQAQMKGLAEALGLGYQEEEEGEEGEDGEQDGNGQQAFNAEELK